MYSDLIPLVPNEFEIPRPKPSYRWVAALVMTAIIIGATLALVIVGVTPSG